VVIRIPGLGKFLLVESGIREFFLKNPKSWDSEFGIELYNNIDWNLEILSKFQTQEIWN